METSPAFLEAAAYLSRAPSLSRLPNGTKLELYGLYKFLTVAAQPQGSRPSMFEIAGRAKWDAWSKTGKEYEDRRVDAETRYLAIAREQGWESGVAPSSTPPPPDEEEGWDEELGMSIADPTDGGGGGGGGDGGMGVSVSAPLRPESERAGGLHEMAIDGDAERLSRFLVEARGVDVDARDEFGYTALHLACDRGNLGVVEILLEHGGDPMLKDPDDLTAVQLAKVAGHQEVCSCLQRTRLDVTV